MKFDLVAYEDWLSKIKKELKKDDLTELHVPISGKISIDPFFGRKPENTEGQRQVKTWKHKAIYLTSKLNNELLLEDLRGGIDCVEIIVDQSNTNWSKAFDNVIFEYIDLRFLVNDADELERTKEELKIFDKDFQISTGEKILQLKAEDYIAELVTGMQKLIQDLDDCMDNEARTDMLSSYRIDRKISAKIIEELAISEAIEILLYNVCKGFGLRPKGILSHAECLPLFEDVERNYIDLSMKALIASLGNYEAIFIAQATDVKASFHHRISRNIHHLLKEESNIHFSRSAFKGAYQIEQIRNKIVHAVWDKL